MICPSRSNDEAVAACNDGDTPPTPTVFHLHHNIVASSSGYFSTFPEPKTGRVINDVDADTFEICVRFMYLGECDGMLSHGNVASILNASELFQIDELEHNCMEYLEHNLDNDNYEQVVELAERLNNPQLKMNVSFTIVIF